MIIFEFINIYLLLKKRINQSFCWPFAFKTVKNATKSLDMCNKKLLNDFNLNPLNY